MYYKIEQLKNILASHKNCVFSLDHLCSSALEYIQHLETGIDRCYELTKRIEAAQPKWISATSEHPEDQAVVLIYCNDGEVGAARFEEEYGCFVTTEKGTWKGAYGAVTHWMPLPKMPKEGK